VPESAVMRGRVAAKAALTKVKPVSNLNVFTCP
jgi:hypothetical protein